MDLQALVNKFKIIAGVYAFDILPDGSYSEIRIMAINALNDMMFNVYPDAPEFYPGVPLRRYFTEINLENFIYTSAVNNEPLYSYVNAFGLWIKGFYLPLDEEGNILNEKGEPNTSPRTAYCLYMTTRSDTPDTDYMSQHSDGVASAVMNISLKLHETPNFYQAMTATVKEIQKICGSERCALYTVDVSNQHCEFINSEGVQADYTENFAAEMGGTPYEAALVWEKALEDSDCLLLDDLSVIKERDPVWYESLRKHDIRNMVLYAVRNNKMLVGFIWAANYDTSKKLQIKETLELTAFLISAVIANHQFVSQLEFKSTIDGLTQLLNRNAMNERVDRLLSGEDASPDTMGVVLADLNGLKTVNDEEGHDAGDKLLMRASALLKLAFGDHEIYRAGGDEFFIFCPDITEDKLNEQAGRLNSLANNTPDVRFAVGSVYLKGEYDIRNAMKTADERMYKDKQEYYRQHPEKDKRKQNR
ncbi:MAG: GGDEF domain-containing protein [Ruminococcus sp.]|nr:GGDEF domain-containing protein [Ruminococcus sp.]